MNEEGYKNRLSPEQYRVMREKGTEIAYTGKYWDSKDLGVYRCAACGNTLFSSDEKIDSKDGWPSFVAGAKNKKISRSVDSTGSTEISCNTCKSHLGYIVDADKGAARVNSIALDFTDDPEFELELPESEEKGAEEKTSARTKDISQSASFSSIGGASIFVAGAAVGGIVGAGAGFLICQNNAAILAATTSPATTTQERPAPASVQQSAPRTNLTPPGASSLSSPPGVSSTPATTSSAR